MCGIAGIWAPAGRLDTTLTAELQRMTASLAHRGPDDEGFWIDQQLALGLGHRRLAILDLSPQGGQPMASADGRHIIVLNGEIYNHRQLRHELGGERQAPWRGHSDTEVLLAAISAWGLRPALDRCVGMFALALWDRRERTLWLVRDRLGEKPLYYGWVGPVFLFASELKAMRACSAWRGEIDRDALALYLRHNYVPAPRSIYRGIHKLLPGTLLRLTTDCDAGELPVPESYWSLPDAAAAGLADPLRGPDHEAVDGLEALLKSAIADQMVADVPLGAFLSGGVDSSTIVALMQELSERPVRTFTIGFPEEGYNEAETAKRVAQHLGTDHTELYVSAQQARDVIPQLPWLYDEPFSDSSQIPTYLLAQLARRHVTVSLSGDGGDELFGGYQRYVLGQMIWSRIGWLPSGGRRALARIVTALPTQLWQTLLSRFRFGSLTSSAHLNAGDKMHKLAEILAVDSRERLYLNLLSHWKEPAAVVLGSTATLADPAAARQLGRSWPYLHHMMCLDGRTYLPDDILVKVDRAAMGVSLESRIPLLDHRIVEFAWRLPLSLKFRHGQSKWVLRQLLFRRVPESLIEPGKRGFTLPIRNWLRGPLRDWAEDLLSEKRLREEGFFRPEPIRRKWLAHQACQRDWHYYLWDVLMFQAWITAQQAPGPTPRQE